MDLQKWATRIKGLFFLLPSSYKPRVHKLAWTSVQVRELKTLARKKTPAARIAKRLKRTEGATRQKAFSLGVSLDTRP
jgi:hypothetical protein